MCQATVYLDGEVIMRDVLMIEPVSNGVRLIALFEPVKIITATIRQIDLIKHKVMLESPQASGEDLEYGGNAANAETV